MAAGALIAALLGVLLVATVTLAADCGGGVVCQCGDRVVVDYEMTADLGPCPRLATGDTIGLKVRSNVTLDCQGHVIRGPGDTEKDAYGIRVGLSSSTQVSNVTVRNCSVTGFWWGVYVQNATGVVLDGNDLYENGWKDPTQNGTGYGLNVANSTAVTVKNNLIADNGNEGAHLSDSSGLVVKGNVFVDNGLEQLYLIRTDDSVIKNNRTEGGTQGLEMRWSNNNAFSYNVWGQAPLHWLENDNHGNTFLYDRFAGRVGVGPDSTGNVFELSEFINPTGNCMTVATADGAYVRKGFFRSCAWDLKTEVRATLDRSVNDLAQISKPVVVTFPGCTADVDLDADVDGNDRAAVLAAMGSVVGGLHWNPAADLDHDGNVDAADLALLDAQAGPCTANLVVTAVSSPATDVVPGTSISVTDTVQNVSAFAAGSSRTQYYLSLDAVKSASDRLIGGRTVPALDPHDVSSATVSIAVPSNMALGTYRLLACADAKAVVAEDDEGENCRTATSQIRVGRPDLVVTALDNPPAAVLPGTQISVTDTVENQSVFPAGSSRIQYYLSADGAKGTGDRLLNGFRAVAALGPNGESTGTALVTIPGTTPAGTYRLLSCANDLSSVVESSQTNNCRTSATTVQVGRPDLVSSQVSNPPLQAAPGSGFSVTDTALNQSPFLAGASRVRFYLSADVMKGAGDRLLNGVRNVSGLDPGEDSGGTTHVTIPANMAAGTYRLLACVDDMAVVGESDETNNCRPSATAVTVSP